METGENILELAPDCSGKVQLLIDALVSTLDRPEFRDMTIGELIGALELVKLNLVLAMHQD